MTFWDFLFFGGVKKWHHSYLVMCFFLAVFPPVVLYMIYRMLCVPEK